MIESHNVHLLERLQVALRERNIQQGFTLLDSVPDIQKQLSLSHSESTSLLLCIAQWVDLGYRNLELLEAGFASFANTNIANLRFIEALELSLVKAFRSLSAENLDEAIQQLGMVLTAGEAIMRPEYRFIAHFWIGRAHRKKGEYELAMHHIVSAREIAEHSTAAKLVAVAKIHESWMIFQRGDRAHAWKLLDEAEDELRPTGHVLSLGNIESSRGRIVRRSGEYTKALTHFERAIAIYSRGYSDHPNCARALVNAAYVKRLIALNIKTRGRDGKAKGLTHSHYLAICKEALEMLARAGKIYSVNNLQSGCGSVLVNAGHLHLESGNMDRAATEAEKAFSLGKEKEDHILMARAQILQSAVQLAVAEEELEEHPTADSHAVLALHYAEEAVGVATLTQNKRLMAEAYITRGKAAAAEVFQDWEIARSCAAKASTLLSNNDKDHLLQELRAFKAKILQSAGIDQTLKQWSEGQLGNKTFQQIQEEFAEIVIPKVWLNQGKNITRVAQQLSISPKKIRRILRNVHSNRNLANTHE